MSSQNQTTTQSVNINMIRKISYYQNLGIFLASVSFVFLLNLFTEQSFSWFYSFAVIWGGFILIQTINLFIVPDISQERKVKIQREVNLKID